MQNGSLLEDVPSIIAHPYHILLQRSTIPFLQRHSREYTLLYLNTDQDHLARNTSAHRKVQLLVYSIINFLYKD